MLRTQCAKRVLRSFFLGLLLTACAGSWVWAAPTLKIVSAPKEIKAGEQFSFQVKVSWLHSDGPYEIQADNPLFENLKLVRQGQAEEADSSETLVIVSLQIQAVKAGEGRILPFEIRYRKPGAEEWGSLPVAGQRIQIEKVFPWKLVIGILIALIGSLVTVVGLIAYGKLLKKERLKKSQRPPDPKQRIYAHAEEAIATYKGETQKETINHWASELKQVVVAYYDLPAKTATESEILAAVNSRPLKPKEFAEVKRLFQEIEQVRFTPQILPIREMETLQKTLLQYVRGKIIIENPPQ